MRFARSLKGTESCQLSRLERVAFPGAQRDAAAVVSEGLYQLPGSAVLVFDRNFRLLMARGDGLVAYGLQSEQMEGRLAADVFSPEQWAFCAPLYQAALTGQTSSREVTAADGSGRVLVRVGPVIGSSARLLGGVATATDITEQHRVRLDLAASEERLRLAMQATSAMAIVDQQLRFVQVNPALCRMLHRDPQWLLSRGPIDVLHPADEATYQELLERAWSGGPIDVLHPADEATYQELLERAWSGGGDPVTVEMRLVRSDGEIVWVDHSVGVVRDDSGVRRESVSQFVNVTQPRLEREALRFLATHDPLTGLVTRDEWGAQTSQILSHPPRTGTELAVLFIDVDGLKPVNDRHGHAAGDILLTEVANRVAGQLRSDDIVARVGGDEFLVALPSIHSAADAAAVAAKIHEAFAAPVAIDDEQALVATVSIGVAVAQPDEPLDVTVRNADRALYRRQGHRPGTHRRPPARQRPTPPTRSVGDARLRHETHVSHPGDLTARGGHQLRIRDAIARVGRSTTAH